MNRRNIVSGTVDREQHGTKDGGSHADAHRVALSAVAPMTVVLLAVSVSARDWWMAACSLAVGMLMFLEADLLLRFVHPWRKSADGGVASPWAYAAVACISAAIGAVIALWPS
ncbi:hypothetical protein AALA48_06310 [Bifidobacterium pseudolongum]|uniref:hypothetical protein n=1 Tax=Bifidobacterium pseudolongum TaxID=1694 RepID=UPI00351139E4